MLWGHTNIYLGVKYNPSTPPPWGIKHLARVGPYSEVHCTSETTPVVSNMGTGSSPFWVSADVPLERPCYRENCTHKDGIFQALEAPISIGFSRFCTHKGRGCLTFFFSKIRNENIQLVKNSLLKVLFFTNFAPMRVT